MTITNGYCTLAEVKDTAALNFGTTNNDTILETTIEAISRLIDNYCDRFFYSVSQTRYYTADTSGLVFVDDIATATGVTLLTDNDGDRTYETTWATTDYDLLPENAETNGKPYNMIQIAVKGLYYFPTITKGVKLTATFGWAAVPKPINRACVMQTVRYFQRYKTMLGVAGTSALGISTLHNPTLDNDVKMLLDPYSTIL